MYRDISEISVSECNVISDNQTINTYDGFIVSQYKLVSNKYYLFETRDYSGMPVNLKCYTTADIQVLPSNFDFIMPIYETMALASVLACFFVAYMFVIHPFWRSKL